MSLDDYSCVLCVNGPEETNQHLFFACPFSTACWNLIGIQWDFSLPPLDMIIQARLSFGSHIFREIFITACWNIWKSRNGIIFDNLPASLMTWKATFKADLSVVCIKAKRKISDPLKIWRENFS